jgi:hypothetical protein
MRLLTVLLFPAPPPPKIQIFRLLSTVNVGPGKQIFEKYETTVKFFFLWEWLRMYIFVAP